MNSSIASRDAAAARSPRTASLILRALLLSSILLVAGLFFAFPDRHWPLNAHLVDALAATAVLTGALMFVQRRDRAPGVEREGMWQGLALGALWVVEIMVNNLWHPPLPGRDEFDDAIWGLVALLILAAAASSAYRSSSPDRGVSVGLSLGIWSGAVACLTGLAFATFGIHAITTDPLSIQEWSTDRTPGTTIQSYWAYQTLGGSLLHLLVLGALMGSALGALGGRAGRFRRTAT